MTKEQLKLKTLWPSFLNHSNEFWCLLDDRKIVIVANSAFKQFVELNYGSPLVGTNLDLRSRRATVSINGTGKFKHVIEGPRASICDPSQTITSSLYVISERVETTCGVCGNLCKFEYEGMDHNSIDIELAQKLLNDHNGFKADSNVYDLVM